GGRLPRFGFVSTRPLRERIMKRRRGSEMISRRLKRRCARMEINLNLFGKRMMRVYQSALRFVSYMGHGFIGSEHLLWALSQDQGAAGRALRRNGLDKNLIEEYLRQYDL